MIAEGLSRGRQVRGQSLTTIEQAHYRCSSKLSRRVMAHKRDKHKYQQTTKSRERESDTIPTRKTDHRYQWCSSQVKHQESYRG